MALINRALPLPIHAPLPPDRYFCYSHQGARPIVPLDCQTAVDANWPYGRSFVRYFLDDPRPSNGEWLPNYEYSGSCRVAIETAGPPEHLPHSILLRPRDLRGLAGYLIQKCAAENRGIGGFLTVGFTSATGFIHNAANNSWSGNFLTISIQPRIHRDRHMSNLEPGSHNANIAALLSAHAAGLGHALGLTVRKWFFEALAIDLHNRAVEMQGSYDRNLTWWSKDGKWDWWTKHFDAFSSSSRNWTLSASGHPDDEESIGQPQRNDSTLDPPLGGDGTQSEENEEEEEEKGEDEEGHDSPELLGATEFNGGTNGESGEEVTSPVRGSRQEQDGEAAAGDNAGVGDMTYLCDDTLGGAPDPVDCEKLSWSGLKPPNSIETLQPGTPKFYSQGTCTLGISSVSPTTILWAHLITAFETLNMVCVQNPIKSVKGGRAYYGRQTVSSWINGKPRRSAATDAVNGTEALPPGINATIFKHDPRSQIACEWTLAGEGKNLSSCRTD